jgi:RNA polymerase sigma factor (sigma-70 family)
MGWDQERFAELYEELYPRALGYALRRAGPEDARDAVDEAFLIAWRKRTDLPEAVLPWLLVTVRNTLANQGRRRSHQDVIAAEMARHTGNGVHAAPESAVVERMLVLAALAELPGRDREMLLITVWDGLTGAVAARVVGCSAAAFAVRLHRARRRFAAALRRLDAQVLSSGDAAVLEVAKPDVVVGRDL